MDVGDHALPNHTHGSALTFTMFYEFQCHKFQAA